MNHKLANTYEHNIEQEIYDFWEKEGYFRPEKMIELGLITKESPRFCITIPLPNITGSLHLGHALTISIEDLMTRYYRMSQNETLFIPGTDHAGIATQNVVERELLKHGIKRKELGKEKFVEKVWEWKEEKGGIITEQSKRMGMSADWNREQFTLNDQCSRAVREAFYRLYQKGLIYRGEYMVNWCPGRCESAISDLETELEEKQSNLWYIKYPIVNKEWQEPKGEWGSGNWAKGATEFITVATTRPETLLGDTAVATTPQHKEYKNFIGKTAVLPVNGRKVPVIADDYVDSEFGTGALKITPGHDPNDFEIAQRHNLEIIAVLNEKASMITANSGKYVGMDRFECRDAIVEDLEKEGLLERIEDYLHSEPHCQRCHTLIEPRISMQWFVKTKPLAEEAIKKVRNKETIIIPEREEKRYYQWMENIHDWCISRQLWWGHQIPIWYCHECGEEICPLPDVDDVSECPKCNNSKVIRDPDVLDTWFSSGLWPFETLGWPDTAHPDYKRFYPNDTRETGYDILFFWVAREMMMGIELTGNAPYKTVYLHGLIRTEKGQKISKSLEDVDKYDPLHIISKYGADSLRYVLISNVVPGLDMNIDPRQLEGAHRFCNKIWQSTRFVLSNIHETEKLPSIMELNSSELEISDKWILSCLNRLIKTVNEDMANYNYLKVPRNIKNFFWGEFCDWYIEITKIRLYKNEESKKVIPKVVLLHVLDTVFRLLHPIMPHITEKLWQALPNVHKSYPALIVTQWPTHNESIIDSQIEENFKFITDFIREVRRVRKDFGIKPNINVPLLIETKDKAELFELLKNEIIKLGKVDPEKLIMSDQLDSPKHSARILTHTAYVPLEGIIDLEKEKSRIERQLLKVEVNIQEISKKLKGPFSQKAPVEVVQGEKNKLEILKKEKIEIEIQLKALS